MEHDFRGIVVPIVTPFCRGRGEIDEEALRALCRFLVTKRVHGLFAVGTAGEFPSLSRDERKRIAEIVVNEVASEIPVIVHTGSINTNETIELTEHARRIGASAAAIVVPYYYTLDEEEIVGHYSTILEKVPEYPVFIYNIPVYARNLVSPKIVSKLREGHRNIVGIKNSIDSLNTFQEYVRISDKNFSSFIGNDGMILPALVMGASGAVSGVAIVFPEVCVDLYEHYVAGRIDEAKDAQMKVNVLLSLFGGQRKLSRIKVALGLRGIEAGGMREPLRDIALEEREPFLNSIRALSKTVDLKTESDWVDS